MCGFLGILRLGLPAQSHPGDEELLRAEMPAIAGRGPDGCHIVQSGPLTMGAVRLAMTGGDAGAQPMIAADGRVVVAFNGEIYNHEVLRVGLVRSYPFRTRNSDTETLCAVLDALGPSLLAKADGQYAIAAYYPNQARLELIRDRFGIHPLFYAIRSDMVAFGSSARAVARLAGTTDIAPEAVFFALALWGIPAPWSVFRNVFTVRPGHALEIGMSGTTERAIDPISLPPAGEESTLDPRELVSAFDSAVAVRLRAEHPLGLLLSGGVDSGAVAQAAALGGRKIPAYVLTPDTGAETTSASATADACGHPLRRVLFSRRELVRRMVATVASADMPLWRTGPVGFESLAKAVQRDGVRGLLTGDGADELFCGYEIFSLTQGRLLIGAGAETEGLAWLRGVPSAARLMLDGRPPLALAPYPSNDDDVLYSHLPRWRTNAGAALRLFHPDVREQLQAYHPLTYMRDTLATELKPLSPLNRARLIELRTLFQGFLISAQSDRPLMSHGIEGRYPFLSRSVADIALRADPRTFLASGENKTPVRHYLSGRIRPSLATVPKQPYEAGPLATGRLFDQLCTIHLSAQAVNRHGMFDARRVCQLAERFTTSHPPKAVDATMLLGVLTTQVMLDG